MEQATVQDSTIESKYLKRSQFSLFYNYFSVIVMAGASLWVSFFFEPTISLIVLWTIPSVLFLLIFLRRKDNIITSVGIYKYSEIFMEIIKSIVIKRKDINQLRVLWKQKTRSK